LFYVNVLNKMNSFAQYNTRHRRIINLTERKKGTPFCKTECGWMSNITESELPSI